MPNDPDFIDYVCDQIDDSCEVSYRHMFGGTTLYSKDKVVALICDNQLFVKPTPGGRAHIGEVVEARPYPGARPSFLIEGQLEDQAFFSSLAKVKQGL